MSDAFVGAVNYVIDTLEGGDKLVTDSGGETKYGISKRANPDINIQGLTRDYAIRLYYMRYWVPSKCDRLPAALALQFFTAVVNMGPASATRRLQTALDVQQDGIIGPVTIGAAREHKAPAELRARFSRACIEFYVSLVEDKPYFRPYRSGWIARVCRVADEAGAWGAGGFPRQIGRKGTETETA